MEKRTDEIITKIMEVIIMIRLKKKLAAVAAAGMMSILSVNVSAIWNLPMPIDAPPSVNGITYEKFDDEGLFSWAAKGEGYKNYDGVFVSVHPDYTEESIRTFFDVSIINDDQIRFFIRDGVDIDTAQEKIEPIIKELSEKYKIVYNDAQWNHVQWNHDLPYFYGMFNHGDTIEKFRELSDVLMEKLRETGIVSYYYPSGSLRTMMEVDCCYGLNAYKGGKEKLTEFVEKEMPDYRVETKYSYLYDDDYYSGEDTDSEPLFVDEYYVVTNDNVKTFKDRLEAAIKVYKGCGMITNMSIPETAGGAEIGEPIYLLSEEDAPAKATLKGDADLSGIVDIADLTTVAKYNLSNEAYPLANEIAFANADMNDDGEVNGVDTSALIENQLGKLH